MENGKNIEFTTTNDTSISLVVHFWMECLGWLPGLTDELNFQLKIAIFANRNKIREREVRV